MNISDPEKRDDKPSAATTRVTIGHCPFAVSFGWETWTRSRKGWTIYA